MSDKNQNAPFMINKIFTKDISFESPMSPIMFTSEWKAKSQVDININHKKLDNNQCEVDLIVTLTTTNNDKECYICEVTQTGLFNAEVPEEQFGHLVGSFCPNILFPYAKEAICNLVFKSGYPQVSINPINFDALYTNQLKQMNEGTTDSTTPQS